VNDQPFTIGLAVALPQFVTAAGRGVGTVLDKRRREELINPIQSVSEKTDVDQQP
jgi:hypothetical protein